MREGMVFLLSRIESLRFDEAALAAPNFSDNARLDSFTIVSDDRNVLRAIIA